VIETKQKGRKQVVFLCKISNKNDRKNFSEGHFLEDQKKSYYFGQSQYILE